MGKDRYFKDKKTEHFNKSNWGKWKNPKKNYNNLTNSMKQKKPGNNSYNKPSNNRFQSSQNQRFLSDFIEQGKIILNQLKKDKASKNMQNTLNISTIPSQVETPSGDNLFYIDTKPSSNEEVDSEQNKNDLVKETETPVEKENACKKDETENDAGCDLIDSDNESVIEVPLNPPIIINLDSDQEICTDENQDNLTSTSKVSTKKIDSTNNTKTNDTIKLKTNQNVERNILDKTNESDSNSKKHPKIDSNKNISEISEIQPDDSVNSIFPRTESGLSDDFMFNDPNTTNQSSEYEISLNGSDLLSTPKSQKENLKFIQESESSSESICENQTTNVFSFNENDEENLINFSNLLSNNENVEKTSKSEKCTKTNTTTHIYFSGNDSLGVLRTDPLNKSSHFEENEDSNDEQLRDKSKTNNDANYFEDISSDDLNSESNLQNTTILDKENLLNKEFLDKLEENLERIDESNSIKINEYNKQKSQKKNKRKRKPKNKLIEGDEGNTSDLTETESDSRETNIVKRKKLKKDKKNDQDGKKLKKNQIKDVANNEISNLKENSKKNVEEVKDKSCKKKKKKKESIVKKIEKLKETNLEVSEELNETSKKKKNNKNKKANGKVKKAKNNVKSNEQTIDQSVEESKDSDVEIIDNEIELISLSDSDSESDKTKSKRSQKLENTILSSKQNSSVSNICSIENNTKNNDDLGLNIASENPLISSPSENNVLNKKDNSKKKLKENVKSTETIDPISSNNLDLILNVSSSNVQIDSIDNVPNKNDNVSNMNDNVQNKNGNVPSRNDNVPNRNDTKSKKKKVKRKKVLTILESTENVKENRKRTHDGKLKYHPTCFENKWTFDKNEFYDQSWGDEYFNHRCIQQKLLGLDKDWSCAMDLKRRKMTGIEKIRCGNCKQMGHLFKNCKKPRVLCGMCGSQRHQMKWCKEACCLNCFSKNRNGLFTEKCKFCCNSQYKICKTCQTLGHEKFQCPDTWRRYHLTINPGKIIKPIINRINLKKWCSGCSEQGHIIENCFKYAPLNLPSVFVQSYSEILQRMVKPKNCETTNDYENFWDIHSIKYDKENNCFYRQENFFDSRMFVCNLDDISFLSKNGDMSKSDNFQNELVTNNTNDCFLLNSCSLQNTSTNADSLFGSNNSIDNEPNKYDVALNLNQSVPNLKSKCNFEQTELMNDENSKKLEILPLLLYGEQITKVLINKKEANVLRDDQMLLKKISDKFKFDIKLDQTKDFDFLEVKGYIKDDLKFQNELKVELKKIATRVRKCEIVAKLKNLNSMKKMNFLDLYNRYMKTKIKCKKNILNNRKTKTKIKNKNIMKKNKKGERFLKTLRNKLFVYLLGVDRRADGGMHLDRLNTFVSNPGNKINKDIISSYHYLFFNNDDELFQVLLKDKNKSLNIS